MARKAEIQTLLEELARAGRAVPPEAALAVRGGGLRNELERLGVRSLWAGSKLERLRRDVETWSQLARELVEVIEEAGRLGERVDSHAHGAASEDRALQAWRRRLQQRLRPQTEGLGIGVAHPRHLDRDRELLAEIQAELERARRLPLLVARSEELMERLGSTRATIELEQFIDRELPDLLARGAVPSARRLADLEAVLESLVPDSGASAQRRPPVLSPELTVQLQMLRAWSHVVPGNTEDAESLQRRVRAARNDASELERLERELDELLRRVGAAARESRARSLEDLRRRLAALEHSCGEQREVRAGLAELAEIRVDTPSEAEAWDQDYQRTLQTLEGLAQNQRGRLREALGRHLEDLAKEVSELVVALSSKELVERAERVKRELTGLRDLTLPTLGSAGGALLNGLLAVEGCRGELRDLGQDQHRIEENVRARRRALEERCVSMRDAAARIGISVGSLDQALPAIRLTQDSTLEDVEIKALAIERTLEEQLGWVVQHARARLAEHTAQIERARAVLALAAVHSVQGGLDTLPDQPEPAVVAAVVERAAALQASLETSVVQATERLDDRRLRSLETLTSMDADGLGIGDRRDLERVREELGEGEWSRAQDPRDRLQALAKVVNDFDLLWQRWFRGGEEFRRRLEALCDQLYSFRQLHLDVFCPMQSHRVELLIEGLRQNPAHWPELTHQLDAASGLLLQVERHARRRAAQMVGLARAEIEQQAESEDPRVAEPARELLLGVERVPVGELPGPELRGQLMRLAPGSFGGF